MQERFVVITCDGSEELAHKCCLYGRTRIAESRIEAVRFLDEYRAGRTLDTMARIRICQFLEGEEIANDGFWCTGPGTTNNGIIYGRIFPVTG